MIKVFGHKSPDTDATCAPLAYAWLLSQKGTKAAAFVLGELNKETKFVLKAANIEQPKLLDKLTENDEVIIVDTNNPEELPDEIGTAVIKTIVDHHKLAGLTTNSPLEIYMKPLGSSSTLVFQLMKEGGITPTREIATILLSGILSDTLNFTSPTTTHEDKRASEELVKISKLDKESHANAMFEAKSDLTGMSAKDILYMDSKVFNFGSKKVRISNIETTKPENAKSRISEIKAEMENVKKEEGLDAIFFFIVDILETVSELFVSGETEKGIAQKAFSKTFNGDYMALPGVVSRKKQMAPAIEKAVS